MLVIDNIALSYKRLVDLYVAEPDMDARLAARARQIRAELGKSLQRHSPEGDAYLILAYTFTTNPTAASVDARKTKQINRIRQGSNLHAIHTYLGTGAWAMLGGWSWKTSFALLNPDTMKIALRAMVTVKKDFADAYYDLSMYAMESILPLEPRALQQTSGPSKGSDPHPPTCQASRPPTTR